MDKASILLEPSIGIILVLLAAISFFLVRLIKRIDNFCDKLPEKMDKEECKGMRNMGQCFALLYEESKAMNQHIEQIARQFLGNNDMEKMIEEKVGKLLKQSKNKKFIDKNS